MTFISGILSETWIHALGWTLLHSLWQGALAAVVLAFIMVFLRRFSSSSRYLIGVTTLALVLCLSVISFFRSYRAEVRGRVVYAQTESGSTAIPSDPNDAGRIARTYFHKTGVLGRAGSFFGRYFHRHFPLLVTLWLCGLLVYFLRFLGGYAYNQWLKAYQTRPAPGDWQATCRNIMAKMGAVKSVRLLESAKIRAPMVIGAIKPVILIPFGLLTGFSREQIDAILMHELAHIVRRDYLVNLFQSFMDIFYFFHPGVRWISASVRTEREHCCDDLMIAASGDSVHFAQALVQIQAQAQAGPALDVSLLGHRGKLLQRVKRLIGRHKLRPDAQERFAAACALFAAVMVLMTAAKASDGWTTSEIARSQTAPPTAAGEPRNAAGRAHVASNVFEMAQDGRGEVIGDADVQGGARPEMLSWIIDESTGEVVWRLSPEMVRESPENFAYREMVTLNKGRYRWFFSMNDLTILKVLGNMASPGAVRSAAGAATPEMGSPPSKSNGSEARVLDFQRDWKGRLRRIRAVVDQGCVQGFALDNITFLRDDIDKNWDFIVQVLSEHEHHQYAYKRPHGRVVNPREHEIPSRRIA